MAINTLITLKDALTAFANGHGQLQGRIIFEADDHRSAYITEESEFPILFVAPISVQIGRAMNTHSLRCYVYERINDDRTDVIENANDTSLILRDIRVWWNDYGVDDIQIIEDVNAEFGSDKELDNLVGYFSDIRFELPSHGRCDVPVDVQPIPVPSCADASYLVEYVNGTPIESGTIPSGGSATIQVPNPLVCDDATVENSDLSYTATVSSGDTLVLPDITVTDSDGSTFTQPAVTNVVCTFNPPCDDAIVNINSVFWDNVPSGGTENIIVRQSSGSTQVGSIQGQYFRIADSTAVVKNSVNTVISTTLIKAEDSEDIILPDETITITDELGNPLDVITFPVYSTLNIDIDSYCTPCPPAVTRSTATLMKTGQTTSYRTGDDGDLEVGRDTDFFTLAENNPFGNTNRFTDELGGQTYTNDIVIDWSTYNGANVLGYNRNINYWAGSNWNTAIDNALLYSIGTYTSGWYLANKKQHENLQNINIVGQALNYAPFNYTTTASLWTSTTDPDTTTSAYRWNLVQKTLTALIKTAGSNMRTLAVRTFTVTGTTLT
jgi:hypothetical protein